MSGVVDLLQFPSFSVGAPAKLIPSALDGRPGGDKLHLGTPADVGLDLVLVMLRP